jgi:pyrimidine-specific ribonucleoside hydrolase
VRVLVFAGAIAAVLALAACAGDEATAPTVAPAPTAREPAAAPLPVVVDTDLGADDVIALALLLVHPGVDVRAVTVSGTGLVHCPAGAGHVRSILLELGVEDRPVGCGRTDAGPDGLEFPAPWRKSSDTLYGLGLPAAMGGEAGDAVTVLREAIAAGPPEVTVVALGPWTNLEDLVTGHPDAVPRIARIHAMAGAIDVPGNANGAEWNVRADPSAVGAVLRTGVPVTLVPLDATNAVPLEPDFLDRLGANASAPAASLAWRLLDRNRFLLASGQYLWDELAAIGFVEPALLRLEPLRLRVDASGRLSRADAGRKVEAALGADGPAAVSAIREALREPGDR